MNAFKFQPIRQQHLQQMTNYILQGATIQMNEYGAIKVARIMLGGAADRSGTLKHGGHKVI